MAMINTQTLNASQSTFNQVQGNQYNYHTQQINIGTADTKSDTRALVRWLYSLPFDTKHQFISGKLRQPGTGLWLLEDHRFKTWISTKGSFLWLHGIPGSGKTVLTSTVIDAVQSQVSTADHGFAYFYADFSEFKTRQPKQVLRSILAQLLSKKPELVQTDFSDFIERMHDNHEPPSEVSELTGLIVKACSRYEDATLVLDALDECEAREDFIPCFEALRDAGTLRILVTSRKEKDIRDAFRSQVAIALDGEGEHIHADMEKHIRLELDNGRGLTKIPQRMKDIIISSLLERAEGMFRWVQCQLDQIRTMRTNKKIIEAMKNLPTGLFATYDRILENILNDDVEFAQKTLSWLLVSDKPLRLAEIVDALAVDVHSRCLDRDPTLNDEQDLLEICSSLVAYNEDTECLSFSHFSVQEYLLSSHLSSGSLARFQTSIYQSHRDLGRLCLTYILFDDFSGNSCETQSEFDDQASQYPFLDYASRCWDAHAAECPDVDDVFELSMEFLASNTFSQNYINYLQARQRSAVDYFQDKPPLSVLTNARLTWMLKRIATGPPNWYNDELGRHGTPLVNAVFINDVEMINFLLDAGVDINKPTDHHVFVPGATPLYVAALNWKWSAFDVLLRRGADVNKPHTYTHDTPLHEVCRHGHVERAKQLLELGSKIDSKNQQGLTPLHSAIRGGSLETVKFLVAAGAEIVSRNNLNSGKTAIHYAIELRSEAITEYLLECCDDLGHLHNITLEHIQWAKGKPWFARLRRAISPGSGFILQDGPKFFSAADVMRAAWIFQKRLKLPPGVTAIILDEAEYWVRIVSRRDELWIVDQHTPERPYVQVTVPGWGGMSPVRRIIFRTRSHDQGYSSYPEHHGTYRASSSWFDVRVALSDAEIRTIHFQDNVHASSTFRDHTNVWDVRDDGAGFQEWLRSLKSGLTIEVYAKAFYPGWLNVVESAEVEIQCAWVPIMAK